MAKIDRHTPGSFCWFELGTTDQAAAKSFYSSLFGWTPVDSPLGPGEYYTIFQLQGRDVAAAYTMPPRESAHTPPHWNLYVAVDSADDSASRAAQLGGKVVMEPFDVMTFGRMAVLQDPTGPIFHTWQSADLRGTTLAGEPGTVCWADLSTPDPARARKFYEGLFGWAIGPEPNYPPDYLIVRHEGHQIAGIPPAAYRNPNVPPHWMLFFKVTDADDIARKAKELRGSVLFGPTSAGPARMAVLTDPQGSVFSIVQPPA